MTLSLTLGMSVGLKHSLHMMWGELIGVGLVTLSAAVGVAALLLQFPAAFLLLKFGGGLYLGWMGISMWQSKGKMAIPEEIDTELSIGRLDLALRGFLTAISNPKAWAFMVSLLPPFLNQELPLAPQLALLIGLILVMEFASLLLYAVGGQALRHVLLNRGNVRLLNRVTGSMLIGVGIWLAFG